MNSYKSIRKRQPIHKRKMDKNYKQAIYEETQATSQYIKGCPSFIMGCKLKSQIPFHSSNWKKM